LARFKQDYEKFKERGAEILAVGPDGPKAFRVYWGANQFQFPGLADADHAVALRYKQQVNIFKLGRMPLVCVVDAHGLIRYAHYGASMSDIPENKILLDVIDQLNAASK
jgi:peroxiredoxin